MIVDDIRLDPEKTDPRLQQIITGVIDILNTGGYQMGVAAQPPVSGDPGVEGESRIVVTGATMAMYIYANGKWWGGNFTAI